MYNQYVNQVNIFDKICKWFVKIQEKTPLSLWFFMLTFFAIHVISFYRTADNTIFIEGSLLVWEFSFFVYLFKRIFFSRGVSE